MTEPRTEAGKGLHSRIWPQIAASVLPLVDRDILAIEAEARAALLDELRGEVEGLLDRAADGHFVVTEGSPYIAALPVVRLADIEELRTRWAALLEDHKGAGK